MFAVEIQQYWERVLEESTGGEYWERLEQLNIFSYYCFSTRMYKKRVIDMEEQVTKTMSGVVQNIVNFNQRTLALKTPTLKT